MANGYQSRETNPQVVSGKNTTGSTIAKGTIVVKSTGTDGIAPAASATAAFLGVAGEDIPVGGYGRVVIRGTALVKVAAAQTIGARVTSDASGKGAAWVATNAVLGIANEVGAADVLIEVELSGPGGIIA